MHHHHILQVPKDLDPMETSVALDEFLDGEIDWDKTEESIEQ